MEIIIFAQLREHFPGTLSLSLPPGVTAAGLLKNLAERVPAAAGILLASRVADARAILPAEASLEGCAECYVLPPSSGG